MKFDVVKANIVNVSVDAIVLPANEKLKEGSGTSKAIFEAAGRNKLTKACKEIGHCDKGSAVPTLAFDLNAKYIIHAVVPRWIDGNSNEYDLLSSAYLTSLSIADIMGCESIAFPLLASGNNGFDMGIAINIAKESIEAFSEKNLKRVILVVYGNRAEKYIKELGYHITVIPEDRHKAAKKAELQQPLDKLVYDGIDMLENILEDNIKLAYKWLQKPENQRKVIELGIKIAKRVLGKIL
jgi:O-acetyl-ADP-ribose deacetylase (regulator of RNase III)